MRFGKVARPSVISVLAPAVLLMAGCSKPAPDPPIPAPPAKVKSGTSLIADPDPILVEDPNGLGFTTIRWSTTAEHIQLRIGGPGGQLFWGGRSKGEAKTGLWVNNGMTFYLQDADAPNPTSADATLGTLSVAVQETY